MSAFRDESLVSGPGWTAIVTTAGAELHIDPDMDALPEAVDAVVSPARRRFTTVEWMREDQYGWDVYLVDYAGMSSGRLAQVYPLRATPM